MTQKKPPSPARCYAWQVLDQVLTYHHTLDEILPILEAGCSDPRDQALGREIISGTCREWERLRYILNLYAERFSQFPTLIQRLLELSVYQLQYLDRVPHYAVISDAVELARRHKFPGLAPAVNGILRAISRNQKEMEFPKKDDNLVEYLSVVYSHPSWLIERWREIWTDDEVENLCRFNNHRAPLSLRIRFDRDVVIRELDQVGVPFRIDSRFTDIITVDPAFSPNRDFFLSKSWVIQDGAASLIARIVHPQATWRIWDVCAAPGGKTLHLADLMQNQGTMVSTDRNPDRLHKLIEQVNRLELSCVTVFPHDPLQGPLPREYTAFDAVLLDVPCTGWGTFRRNPDLRRRLLPGDSARLGQQAYRLLEAVHTYVKSGGILVYSTCTLSPDENENVIESFLKKHTEFLLEPVHPYLSIEFQPAVSPHGWLSLFPAQWDLDGAFAARLRKRE